MKSWVLFLTLVCVTLSPFAWPELTTVRLGTDTSTSFMESFALSESREEVLKELIPGTENYYYFHCLHYQNIGRFDEVDELVKTWVKRHERTRRVREIQNRQALLRYPGDPSESLKYLKHELGVNFGHHREVAGQKSSLPTALDPKLLSRDYLTKQTLARHAYADSVAGFEDSALEWLTASSLNAKQRRALLKRLTRPDYANLVELVAADLDVERSRGFGSLPIHGRMLQSQLDELLRLNPLLLNQRNFVNAYLTKLRPNPDVDWQYDIEAREAYLDRLQAFAKRLDPSRNSLKVHVLHHRLSHDRAKGIYDKARFMEYIKLPRAGHRYMNRDYMKQRENRNNQASLQLDFRAQTGLPIVGDDTSLISAYLKHFFVEDQSYKAYEKYLDDVYLRELFAETKIVTGQGDMEQWYSLLPPAKYQAIKDRIDLDFDAANAKYFEADEAVALDVWVKNVETLLVKVFEINTENYYRQHGRRVNTDINLDGLVANGEEVFTYEETPFRRVKRSFEFATLNKRGVYVVEFIGNGMSSRAVITKGRLHYLVRTSTAGHVFTILDENKHRIDDAALWVAGHEYTPDKEGFITVPFTNEPGRRPMVMSQRDFAYLDHFDHQTETYSLAAGIHVDRESLRPGREAEVAVRPALALNGIPVTLSVLEETRLVITSTDREGTSTTQEIRDFKLFEDRVATHTFRVPENLQSIAIALHARVENLSQNKKIDLAVSKTLALNRVDTEDKTEAVHLSQMDGRYLLEVLGKTGEAKEGRPLQCYFKHRDFKNEEFHVLQTDAKGRIDLGSLKDIAYIKTQDDQGMNRIWHMEQDRRSYPGNLHGQAGEELLIPYMGQAKKALRTELSLLQRNDEAANYVKDRFDALDIDKGFIRIAGLPAGNYDLLLKRENQRIAIRLTKGLQQQNRLLADYRQLEVTNPKPLHITDINASTEAVKIQLANTSPFARVHVAATRFMPAYSIYGDLAAIPLPEPYRRTVPHDHALYLSERNIGDEYRYILDRKYATKFPGNTLERPGLLIAPWAISKTQTDKQDAAEGEDALARAMAPEAAGKSAAPKTPSQQGAFDYGNVDFLSGEAVLLLNLVPDKNGVVTIPREDLNGRQQLHVVAADPNNTVYRDISLPEDNLPFLDLRLARGLDPKTHSTEQKRISTVNAGEEFVIDNLATSSFEIYDDLAKVYRLFTTLSRNSVLSEFSFVTRWPSLSDDEKQEKYSKYACHELNFFLYKKDPPFFASTVRPFIENKHDKTFLDHWLLGGDFAPYLEPWAHGQLNIVEQILLAEKIVGEREVTKRHVADLYNLLPPDIERFNYLFRTALQGSALETDGMLAGSLGLESREQLTSLGYLEGSVNGVFLGASFRGRGGRGGGVAKDAPHPAEAKASRAFGAADVKRGEIVEKMAELISAETPAAGDYLMPQGDMNADGIVAEYFAGDYAARGKVRQLYRKLDKTEEWVENNYYHVPIEQQIAGLITVNAFWRDYATRDHKAPFLSTNAAEAARNFSEMMLALAVLDLPFEAGAHESTFDEGRYTLKAASPVIVYHKQIREAAKEAAKTPILVSQNFFRHSDRYTYKDNERSDKFVTDEFLAQVVYGCQVAVTNPTSARQKLDILLQIPRGALPVLNGKYTRGIHLDLQPYNTTTYEYFFYFPAKGAYKHYPVHVAKNQDLIAYAAPIAMNVVLTPSVIDKTSWDYISQNGTEADVFAFLDENNIHRTNLERIAWRAQDQAVYNKLLDLLAKRHVFNPTLWSYGLKHNDAQGIRAYLDHRPDYIARCGAYIDSELLTIDPVVRKSYQHMEYSPLVNARAHQLGPKRKILNDRFAKQYKRLMRVLTCRPKLDNHDLMAVTYYMLLQDRIEEALAFFKRIDSAQLESSLQYDYFTAYIAFYTESLDAARTVVAKYEDYPVDRWGKLFTNVKNQLAEIDGADAALVDDKSHAQQQTQLAATEPGFEFKVEAKQVTLNYQNVARCRVNYYLMDVELLFSRNPFVQGHSGKFASIRPNFTEDIQLKDGGLTHTFDLPQRFHSSNVMVEIEAGGVKKTEAYYANSLALQLIESYGQVRVTHQDTGKPLATVYVKTYARMHNGQVKFYKDGYTDLRGRFDYASLNTNELDMVQRFALLVISDTDGAVVREAAPPKR